MVFYRFDQIAINVTDRVEPGDVDVDYYVGLEHLDSDSLKIRRWGTPDDVTATKLRFKKGDIIFGRRRVYQRKLGVAEFDGICSAHAMVLRPRTDVVLPEFLPFFMQSEMFMQRALQISVGSLSPTINWRTLAAQEFPLPPLPEQRRIARLLCSIDDLIAVLRAAFDEAILAWRALSKREFTIQGSIKIEPLSKHYEIGSGQVDPAAAAYRELPLIGPNHITSGTGELIAVETAMAQNAVSGKYLFEEGAIVYSKIRPELQKVIIAPFRGLCSADMYPLFPAGTLRPGYLLELLLSDRFTQYAVSGSNRTGMPKINRAHLTNYECQIPDLNSQDEYLSTANKLRTAREWIIERIKQLQVIKNSVLNH